MGAWGTGVFSDDLARDLRDEFRDLISEGSTPEEATASLVRKYLLPLREHDDDRAVFWLSLAATQWKMGHLQDDVRNRAIDIIDSGSNLKIWELSGDAKLVKTRAAVLQKLRTTLKSPQPAAKRIPKRYVHANNWKVGDLVSYRLLSGRYVIFRVIGHHSDRSGRFPVCEMLDWSGDELPSDKVIRDLSVKVQARPKHPVSTFLLGEPTPGQRGRDRLTHLGRTSKPSQKPGGYTVLPWRYIDKLLLEIFGVS